MSVSGHRSEQGGIGLATPNMTLSRLRHDIRNYLNAIKLSSALLQRQHRDANSTESLHDIDRACDGINELVTRFMGDADAPTLLSCSQPGEH